MRVTERGEIPQLPAKAGRGGGFAYSPAANGKRKENAQQIPQLPAKTAGVQLQQEGGGGEATIPATAHLAM